jgi:hypothetical protein
MGLLCQAAGLAGGLVIGLLMLLVLALKSCF